MTKGQCVPILHDTTMSPPIRRVYGFAPSAVVSHIPPTLPVRPLTPYHTSDTMTPRYTMRRPTPEGLSRITIEIEDKLRERLINTTYLLKSKDRTITQRGLIARAITEFLDRLDSRSESSINEDKTAFTKLLNRIEEPLELNTVEVVKTVEDYNREALENYWKKKRERGY
jgi:hypothetical protein